MRKRRYPLLRAYASSEFSTDWGVRGLSGRIAAFFNPRGYQEGAAWPLFTGWTALGEFAYGNSVQGFTHVKELMLHQEALGTRISSGSDARLRVSSERRVLPAVLVRDEHPPSGDGRTRRMEA